MLFILVYRVGCGLLLEHEILRDMGKGAPRWDASILGFALCLLRPEEGFLGPEEGFDFKCKIEEGVSRPH